MATGRSFLSSYTHRYLTEEQKKQQDSTTITPEAIFEFDDSEMWNSNFISNSNSELHPAAGLLDMKITVPPSSRKKMSEKKDRTTARSLPVKIPDWSKILKQEYREIAPKAVNDYLVDDDDDEDERLPPHEIIARRMQQNEIVSFSVHEGIGRTLKGRDLSRVRDSVWEITGFQA